MLAIGLPISREEIESLTPEQFAAVAAAASEVGLRIVDEGEWYELRA
jgi:predicted regulator of Ras-like GTPase activity (Roadblock/LC7/MglB family)